MKTVLSNIPAIVWWLLGGVLLLKILVGVLRWKRVRVAIGEWFVSRMLKGGLPETDKKFFGCSNYPQCRGMRPVEA